MKIRLQAQYKWERDISPENTVNWAENDHNILNGYILYDKDEKPVQEFYSQEEIITYCLDKMAFETEKTLIITDETNVFSGGVSGVKSRNAVKCCVVHGSFLYDPHNSKKGIMPPLKNFCENHGSFDGIVFLTKGERNDFAKKYGFSKSHFEIGHFYPHEIKRKPFGERGGNRAVMVTRFDTVKRVEIAVDIFKLVCDGQDGVFLDIYGYGEGVTNTINTVREQINRLGLGERVFLRGPAVNVPEVFSSAALSIVTSSQESYGLTIIESISNGCPVFSLNVKYGPPEIIRDNSTGFLIENNNKTFAKKIISYFNNPEQRRKMSENCYDDAARFGSEAFLDKWLDFSDIMYKKRGVKKQGARD